MEGVILDGGRDKANRTRSDQGQRRLGRVRWSGSGYATMKEFCRLILEKKMPTSYMSDASQPLLMSKGRIKNTLNSHISISENELLPNKKATASAF